MPEIATTAVSLLLERVVTMLAEEGNLLREVRAKIEDIEHELRRIRTLLMTGEARIENDWADALRELALDTEDCIDSFRVRVVRESNEDGSVGFLGQALHFLKTLLQRRQIAKEIEAIKARAQRLHEIRSRYELQSGSSTGQASFQWKNDARSDISEVNEDQLVGMEERKNELKELLIGKELQLTVISVVGMGGLGKTTVARKLFEDEGVKETFRYRAWICVYPHRSDYRMLLRKLIIQLFPQDGHDLPEDLASMDELDLVKQLKRFLLHSKYLIILDDVREETDWEHIACAFPDADNGSRVMVTAQLQNIVSYSISNRGYVTCVYQLPDLRRDEAWRLFCRRAFRANDCPKHLVDLASSIVERCNGLLLAIVTVAGLLADKSPYDWRRLHDSLIPELQRNDRRESVRRILSLGYDDLPSHLKPCILCFGAFPVIKRRRLMSIWIAEGFVRSIQGRTQEEVAMDYLKELADRSMVQVSELDPLGRTKFCQVHGFMREILEFKCMKQNFYNLLHEQHSEMPPANGNSNQHGPASTAPPSRKIRRLSVRGSSSQVYQKMHSLLRSSNGGSSLRSLIIDIGAPTRMPGTSRDLSYKFVMLRVLDLEGTNVSGLSVRIDSCRLLKYLSLRNTNLDRLPKSLGKLLNLETLDLRGTRIKRLPAEVINLHRLRRLLVPCPTSSVHAAWYQLAARPGVRVPPGVGRLRGLEKLALFDIGHGDGVLEELQNLTQLRKLGVRCIRREDGEPLCAAIKNMSYLRSLVLHSVDTLEPLDLQSLSSLPEFLENLFLAGPLEKLPTWAKSLNSIVNIVLMGSRLMDDLFDAFQGLPNLTHLSMIEAFAGTHLCASNGGFKQLKTLHLCMLNGLDSVTVAEGAMPALSKLSIWYCAALEQVPSGIEHLSSLKELHLLGMDEEFVRKLRRNRGTDSWKVEHIPIIRSSTFNKSQDGHWSGWIEDDLSVDVEAEEEEEKTDGGYCEE